MKRERRRIVLKPAIPHISVAVKNNKIMTYIKFKFPVKLGKGYQFAKGVGARNIIIHNSGKIAKRKYDNDALTIGYEINPLKIETEDSGRHYIKIRTPESKKIYVDEMVANTFCKRPYGSTHFIHVNGDIGDDYCGNIKWVTRMDYRAHYLSKFTQTVNGEDYVLFDDDCYVSKKGVVVDGQGNVRPLQTSVSDSDMGCMRAAVPHVKGENRRSCFLHEMMAEVWLNQDLSDVNSVVYHKNGNICDNDLSNLQIVKRDSKEAKEENENWQKWKDAENIRLSGHI